MKRTPWVVFASGRREFLEQQLREYFDQLDLTYQFQDGTRNYHAILGVEEGSVGTENLLAEKLSGSSSDPVYAVDLTSSEPAVLAFRNGKVEVEEQSAEELAQSLGAPVPIQANFETSRRSLISLALVDGVDCDEVRNALEKARGRPVSQTYHFDQSETRVVISSETRDVGFTAVELSEQLPDIVAYGIIASHDLTEFSVFVSRGGECTGYFSIPASDDPFCPAVDNILGETAPSRILAKLGVPPKLLSTSSGKAT